MLLYNLLALLFVFTLSNGQITEKTIKAAHAYNKTCLEYTRSSKGKSQCEFFRCFEDRFPCGPQYWNLRWGMKYCKKYSEPEIMDAFTPDAKLFLNRTNTCVGLQLEKIYQKDKQLKCKSFYQTAFKIQGKCYAENQQLFCNSFPKNRVQFNKITEMRDYMDPSFLTMIKGALAKCTPPIDLFSLMTSG